MLLFRKCCRRRISFLLHACNSITALLFLIVAL
jgi:hypothetical protein